MNLLDLIIIILIFLSFWEGWRQGFLRALGSLIGFIVGIWVAGHYFESVAAWFGQEGAFAKIIAFIILYGMVAVIFTIVFWILDKILRFIPLAKTFNKLLGSILGILEGILFLGIFLYLLSRYSFWGFLDRWIADSQLAVILVKIAGFLTPLLPEAVRLLKSVIT